MNFMSVVILCAVYSFTSVWSAGLNKGQIETCIELYKNPEEIPKIMRQDFGIEYPERVFKYESNKDSYINVDNLLLVLAYEGTVNSFEKPMLTSFEVDYYVNKFINCSKGLGHLGWLIRDEMIDLFRSLNITDQLAKAIGLVPLSPQGDRRFTAAEFLSVMLDILPEGNGLSQTQIEEYITLYKFNKNKSECFMPSFIVLIFQGLNMLQENLYKANRPAAIELMELMIVMAERSQGAHKKMREPALKIEETMEETTSVEQEENEIVLSTQEVRTLIAGIKNLDKDNDGLISEGDAKTIVKGFFTNNPQVSKKINFNDHFSKKPSLLNILNKKKNVAQILMICIKCKKTVL